MFEHHFSFFSLFPPQIGYVCRPEDTLLGVFIDIMICYIILQNQMIFTIGLDADIRYNRF